MEKNNVNAEIAKESTPSRKNSWSTIGYLVVAFACAVSLWFYVADYDRVVETTIENVQVELRLPPAETRLVAESGKGNYVDIKVKGRKADLSNLKAADLKAYVDVSAYETEIDEKFAIQVDVPDGISLVDSRELPMVTVRLVERVVEEFTVEAVIVDGSWGGNYTPEFEFPKGDSVNIKGSNSIIEKIDKVLVEIDVGYLEGTRTFTESVVLYDSDGAEISQTYLSLDKKQIDVKVDLYTSKELTLKAEYVGGVYSVEAAGAEVTFEPSKVTVYGPLNVINEMSDELVIPIDERNIDTASPDEEYTETFVFKELGDKVVYKDGASSASVSIKQNIATKTLTYTKDDITVILPDDLDVNVEIKGFSINNEELTETGYIDFKGVYESIVKLNVLKPEIYIDFTNYIPDYGVEWTVQAMVNYPDDLQRVFYLDQIEIVCVLMEPISDENTEADS